MSYLAFIQSLSDDELAAYTKKVGVKLGYFTNHLLHARKVPRRPLMKRLAECASPQLPSLVVLRHFYPDMFDESA